MIPVEVKEEFVNGFQEEHYLVAAIKAHLISNAEKDWLFKNGISIEDVLNGRIEGGAPPEVEAMFARWNGIIGERVFGY